MDPEAPGWWPGVPDRGEVARWTVTPEELNIQYSRLEAGTVTWTAECHALGLWAKGRTRREARDKLMRLVREKLAVEGQSES